MQKLDMQTSLSDVYEAVRSSMEKDKARLLILLKAHIKLETLIPKEFYEAFYKDIGRPRDYSLESFIWFHQLKNIIGIPRDKAFLTVLELSPEIRDFCGFDKVPNASDITRFRQHFAEYLGLFLARLVEITEPICRAIDPKKSDYLIHFDRMCIPINPRNSGTAHTDFDDNGTPLCPIDKTPFTFHSISGGKNRSKRFKWVCHKSVRLPKSPNRICTCQTPCTKSSYGRCVYTYPSKNLRLYPGIPRGTDHWNNLYRHRTCIERTINIFKDDFGVAHRRTFSQVTAKADLFLAGITQLLGLILADSISQPKFFKSVRKLVASA